MSELRAQDTLALPANANLVQHADITDDGHVGQCATRSRPVSLYDNYKDGPTMAPCVTSAMSVGNLSQVRDGDDPSAMQKGNNNNNNNSIDYGTNRVSSAVSAGNISKMQSPKVKGAVSAGNIGKIFRSEKEKKLARAPSMANCLSTTVPVNLAASQIAGRHTPTRNSLRHSRMIVMHRTGNIPRKSQPPLLRHRRLARSLAAMQMIVGIGVTSFSLFLLLWAPSLSILDNPYWSGIPLLLSGSFGICLLCCFKEEYPRMGPGLCLSATKIISAFFAATACVACTIACIASTMHLVRLTGLKCTSSSFARPGTCVCRPRGNSTHDLDPILRYSDLDCSEVQNILTIILIFSASFNGLGIIVAGLYCYLHWTTREKRPQYFQVRTNDNSGNNGLNSRPIYNPNLGGR